MYLHEFLDIRNVGNEKVGKKEFIIPDSQGKAIDLKIVFCSEGAESLVFPYYPYIISCFVEGVEVFKVTSSEADNYGVDREVCFSMLNKFLNGKGAGELKIYPDTEPDLYLVEYEEPKWKKSEREEKYRVEALSKLEDEGLLVFKNVKECVEYLNGLGDKFVFDSKDDILTYLNEETKKNNIEVISEHVDGELQEYVVISSEEEKAKYIRDMEEFCKSGEGDLYNFMCKKYKTPPYETYQDIGEVVSNHPKKVMTIKSMHFRQSLLVEELNCAYLTASRTVTNLKLTYKGKTKNVVEYNRDGEILIYMLEDFAIKGLDAKEVVYLEKWVDKNDMEVQSTLKKKIRW